MVTDMGDKNLQQNLVDTIQQLGEQVFDPAVAAEGRQSSLQNFQKLIECTTTLALLPALNLLVQPGRVSSWLRAPLISALARLPLRTRGVQDTIEFILSVHPSTASLNESGRAGKGALISHEALNTISRLLSSPPAGLPAGDWFNAIAPQLLSLLQGEGEPEMDKAAAFVIGFGILGRKQHGVPGTCGWKAFVEPIYAHINPSHQQIVSKLQKFTAPQDLHILEVRRVLSTPVEIAQSLKMLANLVSSHPNPALASRLLRPILHPLWALSSWPRGDANTENLYRNPAKFLLRILLQTFSNHKKGTERTSLISTILKDLTFRGRTNSNESGWRYAACEAGGIQIEEILPANDMNNELDLAAIDSAVNYFIFLLQDLPDLKSELPGLFLDLSRKWLTQNAKAQHPTIRIRDDPVDQEEDIRTQLIGAKMMLKMIKEFPEKLIDDFRQVLELVNQILKDFVKSVESGNSNEDIIAVALSILNIVLTSPRLKSNPENDVLLKSICDSLQSIRCKSGLEVTSTAQNLLMLLKFRNTIEEVESKLPPSQAEHHLEDRKNYNLAMSYLTATDSPPPVRVQGLEILSQLIRNHSSTVDVPALLVLFSSLLQDNEEYIFLRVIKSFVHLSQKHPKAVLSDLIDRYVDSNEDSELDQRLRFGEALLQVIQSNPAMFKAEPAQSVCEGLLFLGGLRGHRKKSEQKLEREMRLKRKQNGEAEEAWGGVVPQLDEVLDIDSPEDYEVLSRIVTGWESKRGAEDVRIRASALSILGSAIEINVEGISSQILSSAVDLSIHILTLELTIEKGILRRAAVVLVMNFIRAIDSATEKGKRLGFSFVGQSVEELQGILGYIESIDTDTVVRQHARDVIEGLKAWQIKSMLPGQQVCTNLVNLRGLSIPGINPQHSKPRIEEIE